MSTLNWKMSPPLFFLVKFSRFLSFPFPSHAGSHPLLKCMLMTDNYQEGFWNKFCEKGEAGNECRHCLCHTCPLKRFISNTDCIQRKTWCRSWLLLTLSHSQLCSHAAIHPLLQRERGGLGKISPIGWAQFYLFANFQNNKKEKGEYGEEGGKGWELILCLWIAILWSMGNSMAKLTSIPQHSWL